MVDNDNSLCPRCNAGIDDRAQKFGIRRDTPLGWRRKGNVRLDHYNAVLWNQLIKPADGLDETFGCAYRFPFGLPDLGLVAI